MARSSKPKQRQSSKTAASDDFFLDNAEELPRADVGGVTKLKSRARFYRGYIITACVLLPFTAVGYLALLPSYLADDTVEVAQVRLDTPTKAAAVNAVSQWLSSTSQPLPGGFMLSWDGVEESTAPVTSVDENGRETSIPGLETHKMTLATAGGSLFTTTVQVAWDPATGPQVIGGPSLAPTAPSSDEASGTLNPWLGTTESTSNASITQAAAAWVEAYTSGEPDRLRLATGDPSAANSYVPLVQVLEAGDVRVAKTATREDGFTLARVEFTIIWEGTPLDASGEPESGGALFTYDLLLDRANTASPVVVAWGGAGTGLDLAPYSNAITGRTVTSQDQKIWSDEEIKQREAASQPEN